MKRILCFGLLLCTFLFFGCGKKPSEKETDATTAANLSEYRFTDINGLDFTAVFSYQGPYVEDGTNEQLENVSAIRVLNNSDRTVRYAEITAFTGMGELHFICTTLLPGRNALLQEVSRIPFNGTQTTQVKIDSEVDFDSPLTLYPEVFDINVENGVMTLKNISPVPVSGDIYIYFKRTDRDGYVGGITYRIGFSDLAAGASVSRSSENLTENDFDILFIGCENPPEVKS